MTIRDRGRKKKPAKPVLSDHRRVGKRLIPPLATMTSPLREVSWIDLILPELVWLALLNDRYGWGKGAELAASLVSASSKACTDSTKPWFAPISEFRKLDNDQRRTVVDALGSSGVLELLKTGLVPLASLYSECPLLFLFNEAPASLADQATSLQLFKDLLASLYGRHAKSAMSVQANAIYIAFVTNKLQVQRGSELANLPAMEKYPESDESRLVASSIRAALNGFFGELYLGQQTPWAQYFWNRGLALEACDYDRLYIDHE